MWFHFFRIRIQISFTDRKYLLCVCCTYSKYMRIFIAMFLLLKFNTFRCYLLNTNTTSFSPFIWNKPCCNYHILCLCMRMTFFLQNEVERERLYWNLVRDILRHDKPTTFTVPIAYKYYFIAAAKIYLHKYVIVDVRLCGCEFEIGEKIKSGISAT